MTDSYPVYPSRNHAVIERRGSDALAMSWSQRWWRRFKHLAPDDDSSHSAPTSRVQYTLGGSKQDDRSLWQRVLTCNGLLGKKRHKNRALSVGNPNQKLAMSLHWAFRVNFLFLFVVMCITFFALVIMFAGLIASAGFLDEECVRVGDNEFNSAGTGFADAFALSWTTLSTVGYGSTYPALSHENESPTNCFYINFICSIESLLGVLYSGFCGAILFGKVLRIQSHAQVVFSDPILLRYGTGVVNEEVEGSHSATSSSEEDISKTPCPILEFRIVNRLFGEPGGEIMDASLNVVANINANDADPSLVAALEGGSVGVVPGSSVNTAMDSFGTSSSSGMSSFFSRTLSGHHKQKQQQQSVDEDVSLRPVQHKHIFSKLLIEAPEHPFFKRCWVATHILDEHSPLLKPRIRRLIRKNGNSWPEKLNNAVSIRESLQFNQILVSLNGVSNISASDVYAQKIYDFVDLNIGFKFVNILYRDNDGSLGVDIDLINDVREQDGGGGEPLMGEGMDSKEFGW